MNDLDLKHEMNKYSHVEELVTHMERTLDAILNGRERQLEALKTASMDLHDKLPDARQKEIARTLLASLHSIL